MSATMTLSERDENDLLGLISQSGTPESDERARKLLERNPEAMTFDRQMRAISDALAPHEVASDVLDEREAWRIAREVEQLADRRQAAARLRRRRWFIGVASTAACMAGAILAWPFLAERVNPTIATRVILPGGSTASAYGEHLKYADKVRPGQSVASGTDTAVLEFRNGTQIVLAPLTELREIRKSGSCRLAKGAVFLKTASPLQLETQVASVSIPVGEVLVDAVPGSFIISVYAGTAEVAIEGRRHQLTAGQTGRYETGDEDLHVLTVGAREIPDWAKRAFERLAEW